MRTQQFKLYGLEVAVPPGRSFTLDEMQDYVDAVVASDWFADRGFDWVGRILVEQTRKDAPEACVFKRDGVWVIQAPERMFDEQTAAHELAHILLSAYDCGHDPRFVRQYLENVYYLMGSEVYMEYYTTFKNGGITIS